MEIHHIVQWGWNGNPWEYPGTDRAVGCLMGGESLRYPRKSWWNRQDSGILQGVGVFRIFRDSQWDYRTGRTVELLIFKGKSLGYPRNSH